MNGEYGDCSAYQIIMHITAKSIWHSQKKNKKTFNL